MTVKPEAVFVEKPPYRAGRVCGFCPNAYGQPLSQARDAFFDGQVGIRQNRVYRRMQIKIRCDGCHKVNELTQAGLPAESVTARPRQAEADQTGQNSRRNRGISRVFLLNQLAESFTESLFLVLVENVDLAGVESQHAGAIIGNDLLSLVLKGIFDKVRGCRIL